MHGAVRQRRQPRPHRGARAGEGVWLYLHEKFYGGAGLPEEVEETVLHELLHNELQQFGEDPAHKGRPWARRCAEISALLGLDVRIERVRSVRLGPGRVTTGTPAGCLPYEELRRWPAGLLRGGPPLRQRVEVLPVLRSCELHEEAA